MLLREREGFYLGKNFVNDWSGYRPEKIVISECKCVLLHAENTCKSGSLPKRLKSRYQFVFVSFIVESALLKLCPNFS